MATLPEIPEWIAAIYQLEEDDLVKGGADGIDNLQAKQLANRTLFLKGLIDALALGKQPLDATLSAISGLVGAADKLAYFNGADSATLTTITAFARSLIAANDAASARTVLGAVTQADINNAVAALVNSSPATLDTLNEFATALGNDPNFATTITTALATKVSIAALQNQAHTAFTTAGAAPNFTLTPVPAVAAYAAGQRFRVKFHAGGNGSDKLNVCALGDKNIMQYDSTGAKVAAVIVANQLTDVEYDGADMVLLDALPVAYLPAGSVVYMAKNTAPTGFLKANGAAVSRTIYAALFAAISTSFGVGDGATTFNLPDLRGEFIRGWDDNRGVDSGRVFGSAQADEYRSHYHLLSMWAATGLDSTGGPNALGADTAGSWSGDSSGPIKNTGGTETRPRNVGLLACIKY